MSFDNVHTIWVTMILLSLVNLVLSSTNIFFSHSRAIRTAARDKEGLRQALYGELGELSETAETNARLLREGKDYLLALKPQVAVYRGNAGRLSLLPIEEAKAIIRTYFAIERLDAIACALGKPQGALVYKITNSPISTEHLIVEFTALCDRIALLLNAKPDAVRFVN